MVYELTETDRAAKLFEGWEETIIYSCLQKVMGKLYAAEDSLGGKCLESAAACLGDFMFFAGKPCKELVMRKPDGYVIMVPQTEEWASVIKDCFLGTARQITRYAMRKDTVFHEERLKRMIKELPREYRLQPIDEELYDQCIAYEWSRDLVSGFESKAAYMKYGLGVVITKNGEIVSGASSYSIYRDGIEIEVDTREDERRKSLAAVCCAELILECLKRKLYPSWDAHTLWSVHLAEKLGYEFSHEYIAYEVVDYD